MKKNIILLLILSFLICIAYFTEEIVKKEKKHEVSDAQSLISTKSHITEIKTNLFHLVFTNSKWHHAKLKTSVDQELVKEIIKVISGLSVNSKISDDPKQNYFSENQRMLELYINGTWESIIIGNVSKITGGIFVKSNKMPGQVLICYDKSFLDQIYSSDLDLDLKKYVRLRNILEIKKDKLIERNLFKFLGINIKGIEKVRINNKINRWFSLNLKENTLFPAPLKGIKVKNIGKAFGKALNGIKVLKDITQKQNILSNISSEIKIVGNQNISMKLYSGLNGKYGKFLKVNDQILQLELENKSLFFLNLQDFWNKRIEYNVKFNELKKIQFSLGFSQSKLYEFNIDEIKKFKVKTKNKNISFISDIHMNFLFNLLLNLTEFEQAKYIDTMEVADNTKYQLYALIFGKKLGITIKNDLIEVVDFEARQKFFYKYNTQQIKPDFLLKIFTVKKK